MKDLQIQYKGKDEKVVSKSYDTIMDFIDEMESDNNILMPCYEVVSYMFFENQLNAGGNTTIKWLLGHCKEIIK